MVRAAEEATQRAERVAAQVLERFGLGLTSAVRAPTYVNAVWLTKRAAVRVALEPGSDLHREARLGELLPAEVGYPALIATGTLDGVQWVLSERVRGDNLGQVWKNLDWQQRAGAMAEMWRCAEAVHSLDVGRLAPFLRVPSPFYAATSAAAAARLGRLAGAGLLTARQVANLGSHLERYWSALPAGGKVACHGDFSPINAMWDGGHVVALLDFEFATIGPAYVDLGELLKLVFAPEDQNDPLGCLSAPGRQQAEQVLITIGRSIGTGAPARNLVVGHSVLLESWLVEHQLADAVDQGVISNGKSFRLLAALAEGGDGFLSPITGAL